MDDKIEYIKNLFKTDMEKAHQEFIDFWIEWHTFGGQHFEGVVLEIEDDDYHVLCTDGVKRVI